ncbi:MULTISPECIES: LacI family DNA-binding transcriptional regulator [Pontibacillus]|uniref:LacI family DNA-binding transcriptional regulator n=1 Tax=Pontibacillus chungwhensis TaxID=265426 RepID=A0ABY8V433_9BACI|nr:LacI family DNA-binding transcriptional regulator [Pontibacillus chungwhensis]MCD5324332.1 LacI family transcriptional regulator [Pontibacillus sp. HN14]WIF99370.1 LacI family DNA-binding transcriptional regulator [Pontibacillus chungwhensis]
MNPTIQDVARLANVSIATVSRVLNDQPGYSEKTKQKVLKIIEELGYQPNAVARGLVNQKTGTIGVLFPSVSGLLSAEILHGIETKAHEHRYSVIVCNTAENREKTIKYLQVLREKRVDGLIFVSEAVTEEYYEIFCRMDIPVVLVSTQSYQYPLPFVKVDDRNGAYAATKHLIDKGHAAIGMIAGSEDDPIAGWPRIEGYRHAMREAGLSLEETLVQSRESFHYHEGRRGFQVLMKDHPELTAIFAASDELALGAISAAYEASITIPEDVSIIGYDNLILAEMSVPPLTTIAQPFKRMGSKAVRMMLDLINGKEAESTILPHELVIRDSVKSR